MTPPLARGRLLRIALLLTMVFDLLALLVFARGSPRVFTVFMFFGPTMFVGALLLLAGAVVADLRARPLR